MTATMPTEVHDEATLAAARALIDATDPAGMQREVLAAVERNADWRGRECINLLAPEALVSPAVQRLLSSEGGQRAGQGHIGPVNRWFAGTPHRRDRGAVRGAAQAPVRRRLRRAPARGQHAR